jgi:hypothetical protein
VAVSAEPARAVSRELAATVAAGQSQPRSLVRWLGEHPPSQHYRATWPSSPVAFGAKILIYYREQGLREEWSMRSGTVLLKVRPGLMLRETRR